MKLSLDCERKYLEVIYTVHVSLATLVCCWETRTDDILNNNYMFNKEYYICSACELKTSISLWLWKRALAISLEAWFDSRLGKS